MAQDPRTEGGHGDFASSWLTQWGMLKQWHS